MVILQLFPKLTAAGPSGLHLQHLIDASEMQLRTPILYALRAVVNLLAPGRAPSEISAHLAGSNLTAPNKSKSGCALDIRSIAVGEARSHLVGKCLCGAVTIKAEIYFAPFQFGVACSLVAE